MMEERNPLAAGDDPEHTDPAAAEPLVPLPDSGDEPAGEVFSDSTAPGAESPPPAGDVNRQGARVPRAAAVLLALGAILAVGAYLRFLGMDWDAGQHLHPDERFLTMVQGSMRPPAACSAAAPGAPGDVAAGRDWYGCILGYLDTDTSPLNPRNTGHSFFSYGTWSMTLVNILARNFGSTGYDSVFLAGRRFSAVLDLLALALLFGVGARLYDWRVGLLAAALGAGTAFFIQQAHFMTVDAPANFFVMLFFFGAVGMVRRGRWPDTLIAGVGMGMALATKISMWPLAPVAVLALAAEAWRRGDLQARRWRPVAQVIVLGLVSFATLRLCQPDMFAGPGWPNVVENPARLAEVTAGTWLAPQWWHEARGLMPDALEPYFLPDPRWADSMAKISTQVTGYGMDWPPNHQWWGRTDWVFPWQNMVLWGMGLPLGLAAWAAWAAAGYLIFRRGQLRHLLPWLWITIVFAYYGGQWGKTMRYFLPIYPTLILLAAWGMVAFRDWSREAHPHPGVGFAPAGPSPAGAGEGRGARWARLRRWAPGLAPVMLAVVLGGTVVWGFMFSRIYSREHSRVAASRWIYHNLPTAFGMTVMQGEDGRWMGPGAFMPAGYPAQLQFAQGTGTYTVDGEAWVGPGRVLVPGGAPVTVDGAQLNFVTDPAGDRGDETFRVVLSTKASLDAGGQPDGILAEGSAVADLDAERPQSVRVDLPQTVLQPDRGVGGAPGGEYYLWFQVAGGPVSGRSAVIAHDSQWDDPVPVGMEGYGPWDQAETPWGEGMFGFAQLNMFDEDRRIGDRSDKLERTIAALERADYAISSSNRVYGSVRQMPTRYPMTIRYYDALFGEEFGFEHVRDIHSYPSLGPWEVDDQPAEEAWHVYDHPRVDVWDVSGIDTAALQKELFPLTDPAVVTWEWPRDDRGLFGRIGRRLGLSSAGTGASAVPDAPPTPLPPESTLKPLESVMLSPERREAERTRADYVFRPESLINRSPLLSVVVWYLALAALGLAAFPLVSSVLPNLMDRGWAVARAAGLLITSWLAWAVASLGWADHTPLLVWAAAGVMTAMSLLVLWPRRREMRGWLGANRRLLVVEEGVFLGVFALFLLIRIGNPDLWHPYYGGEKPMDFAYLNAVLRTVSFPPFDPWFAGGKLNYYYFGFVFIGALMEMTGIVPWVAYNLAIPSLAAMTGLGAFGVVYNWSRAAHRPFRVAVRAGGLGALLAVISGNLFQVPFILGKLAEVSPLGAGGLASFESALPGLGTLVRAASGWWAVMQNQATLVVSTGHWYWNASRAIPEQGDTVAITEMPFFTFIYADLHAHMMALPITVLALTVALSWATLTEEERLGYNWPLEPWGLGRLLLGALAIGALWPANTWDYPTYGLVAAGALAAGHWERMGGPGWRWLIHVGLRGALLLGLSLLFFAPYHLAYVTPYADFREWESVRTPLSAYLIVHGIFLFAVTTWALVRLAGALAHRDEWRAVLRTLAIGGIVSALVFGALWWRSAEKLTGHPYPPSPWTPFFAAALLTLGLALLLRPRARAPERFAAWVFVLGVLLTQFVEYVVLDGDIGRMNTVFKFYIQVWVLWAALAALSAAWIAPLLRGGSRGAWGVWGNVWRVAFAALVACGLVYPITAARAKVQDRFPAAAGMDPGEREGYEQRNFKPSLSGIAYQDYATYDESLPGGDRRRLLRMRDDRDAFMWLLANVKGSPVILEGYNINGGYRWGGRYSIYTGLPSVIGWDWHQKQQRNAVGGQFVDERTRDVATMYNTTDIEEARALLEEYAVEYVVVGDMERVFYDPAGLAKFDTMVEEGLAELVYSSPTAASRPAAEGSSPAAGVSSPPASSTGPGAGAGPGASGAEPVVKIYKLPAPGEGTGTP